MRLSSSFRYLSATACSARAMPILRAKLGYDSYQEGNMVKYTMGASTNYNEIFRLRKTLAEKFPEAFIIAFKNGKKYDVNQAIREFKQNRNR